MTRATLVALLSAAGLPNEASLREIVATSPELLPLSGSPSLAVVDREILAGRPVIVEVKLRRNLIPARRLAYAGALHGLTQQKLERDVLSHHLKGRSLLDVVRESECTQKNVDAEALAESSRSH